MICLQLFFSMEGYACVCPVSGSRLPSVGLASIYTTCNFHFQTLRELATCLLVRAPDRRNPTGMVYSTRLDPLREVGWPPRGDAKKAGMPHIIHGLVIALRRPGIFHP